MSNEPVYRDALAFMCRHVVALSWFEGKSKSIGTFAAQPDYWGASGFILSINGIWCLATAGHVFSQHKIRKAKKGIEAAAVSVIDGWAQCKPTTLAFDFLEAPNWPVDEEDLGLDFAVVSLPLNTALLLSKTTIPFRREDWINQGKIKFDFYAMVGFPVEAASQYLDTEGKRKSMQVDPNPVMIFVKKLARRPKKMKATKYPRFYGQLDPRTKTKLERIEGMSGGPIFGFRKEPNGQLRYWPVAIQSTYHKDLHTIAACPLTRVGKMIDELFAMKEPKSPKSARQSAD